MSSERASGVPADPNEAVEAVEMKEEKKEDDADKGASARPSGSSGPSDVDKGASSDSSPDGADVSVFKDINALLARLPSLQQLTQHLGGANMVMVQKEHDVGLLTKLARMMRCEIHKKFQVGILQENNQFVPLFDLQERGNCCLRQMCVKFHALSVQSEEELFIIDRPFRMGNCCCPHTSCCGRDYMAIQTPGGNIIGEVLLMKDSCATCSIGMGLRVLDANENEVCEVFRKNCCLCNCCGDVIFEVLIDGEETGGVVAKEFGGMLKEMFTECDNFRIEFPPAFGQDGYKKLLLVCTAMMLDIKWFTPDKN